MMSFKQICAAYDQIDRDPDGHEIHNLLLDQIRDEANTKRKPRRPIDRVMDCVEFYEFTAGVKQ